MPVLVVLAILCLPLTGVAGETGDEDAFYWIGIIEPTGRTLGPGASATPLTLMYDLEGSKALLRGYDHEDELRVVDGDLETLAILEPPSEGFSVDGAVISANGNHVFAWGRTPTNTSDMLVAYNLTDYRWEEDYLPQDLLGLEDIYAVRLMAGDKILVVAGKDTNDTKQLLFVEVVPKMLLKTEPVPGNLRVIDIVHDGIKMIVLLGDGSIVLYSTYDWTMEQTYQVFKGPFSAYEVKRRSDWHFGSSEGVTVSLTIYDSVSRLDLNLTHGPVQGVYSVEYYGHLITAIPEEASGSRMDAWVHGQNGWESNSKYVTEATVTSMVEDPNANSTFAVMFDDGSMEFFQVGLKKRYFGDDNGPAFMDRYGIIIGPSIVIAIILTVRYLLKRRKADQD
ncbi:MAG: hypothetical protein JSW25_09690 [Thermoplasmata archaeon]|nr:MAG: hypothetical protein JSW25_09690 [Thermoplasmata archaeon]